MLCLIQSGMFSGLNLAIFSLSKLELEVEAKKKNVKALKVLKYRSNSNFTLVTILWGNVAVNVLLALLADSVLAGISAFIFSTVIITFFAEIIPQAYFSRHAIQVAAILSPVLRFYQFILFPIARPVAFVLDKWLGGEGIRVFKERDMHHLIKLHIESADSDIAKMEGKGALNFLAIDDVLLSDEGEAVAPDSIIKLDFVENSPVFPQVSSSIDDAFLKQIYQPRKKWIIITDSKDVPKLVLRAKDYIAAVLFKESENVDPLRFCQKPIVALDSNQRLGKYLPEFKVSSGKSGKEVIENDVILFWTENPRIISGGDILGRLFRGIGNSISSADETVPHSVQKSL